MEAWIHDYLEVREPKVRHHKFVARIVADRLKEKKMADGKSIQVELEALGLFSTELIRRMMLRLWEKLIGLLKADAASRLAAKENQDKKLAAASRAAARKPERDSHSYTSSSYSKDRHRVRPYDHADRAAYYVSSSSYYRRSSEASWT